MNKKLLTISLILFCTLNVISQEIYKFRTQNIAIKYIEDDGTWSEWSSWADSSNLVIQNTEDQRITIYGEPNRTFDIISYKETTDDDGNKSLIMNCIGHNQKECVFEMVYDLDNN